MAREPSDQEHTSLHSAPYPGVPDQECGEILADLVKATPGKEAKWFAVGKEAGLYDEAIELARRSPC